MSYSLPPLQAAPASGVKDILVLLIEDSPVEVVMVQSMLTQTGKGAFTLEKAGTLADGLKCLDSGAIGLVLLDLNLPDSMGWATFARLRAYAPDLPVIVLSGMDDASLAVRTLKQGAQDYLVKGQYDGRLLVRSIRYAVERHRIEHQLEQERDLLHTLLDHLPDRIYFKDAKSRFLRISRSMADLFKLDDPESAVGKTDFDYFTKEHAQPAFDDEQRIMESGQPMIGRIEKETLPDGNTDWVLTSKVPLRDKNGMIVGTFGISRVITALREMEAKLTEERTLLRNLIDHLPDYIYVKDSQGRYVIDNIAHTWLLGVSGSDQVIGKTVFDFFPPTLAASYHVDDLAVMDSGHPMINREEPSRDQFGNQRWLLTTKVPLRDSQSHIIGLVCISRDNTARRRAEEQLKQLNADLQHANEALKAAQMQLIEAEKMQSVGRLAAGVAHEVKNPLAIMGMGLDYLTQANDGKDPNSAMVLKDMTAALQRADAIIMGLIDFAVPSDLKLVDQDLNAIIVQSLTFVRHELAGLEIEIVRQLDPSLPKMKLDSNKITQVFVNLLTNAIHSMPNGGTLTLRTYSRELQSSETNHDAGSRMADRFRPGEVVGVAEIDDTGCGITPEKLPKVFDPFFTTKPTGKGTGLGLTVTRKIIELHSGSIDIQNRPEGGVRVTMMFKI